MAHKPWRAFEAEKVLAGAEAKAETFRYAAEAELANAKGFAHNRFKIELANRTVVSVLSELAEKGGRDECFAEYYTDSRALYARQEPDPLMHKHGYLGKPFNRVDAQLKVKGEARFAAEFKIENLAYAALVHSTIAKGRVAKIDASEAKRSAGVYNNHHARKYAENERAETRRCDRR